MPVLTALFALASLSATAPGQPSGASGAILVAEADGSWLITETIGESGAALAIATDGLLIDEEEWAEAQRADREQREAESDEALRRAFEEAADSVRREPQP